MEDYQEYLFDDNEVTVELVENSLALYNDNTNDTYNTLFVTLNHHLPIESESIYTDAIKAVMKKIHRKYSDKIVIDYYFERAPTTNKLHVHGMLYNIPEACASTPYSAMPDYVMKEFHKIIGRKYIPRTVSSLTEWTKCYTAVSSYISKSKNINHRIYREGRILIHYHAK